MVDAQNTKTKNDAEWDRWLIWHQATLTRAKTMPPMKKFVHPAKEAVKVGIDQDGIKARLKAYQDGKSSKS